MSKLSPKPRIKVSGMIARKSEIRVAIGDMSWTFSSVTQAVQTLISAAAEVCRFAESEYQAGRTDRRFQ